MDDLQIGDVLITNGKPYVSLQMYKDLQNKLHSVQNTAEYFLQQLTAIEVANETRRNMRINVSSFHNMEIDM